MSVGNLFVLSGPSGVGKSAVLSRVQEARGEDLLFSVSATSRKPRPNEVDGVHYFFITPERFRELIEEDAFVEYDFHNDTYYGTLKSQVAEKSRVGNLVLDIEPNGANNLKKQFPQATTIFLVPPSMEVLEARLRGRKDTDEAQMQLRLERARWELTQADSYDFVVENGDLDTCVNTVLQIIAQKADEKNLEE